MPNELSIITRYRETHHSVARMVAADMTPSMIHQRTGLSQRRLTLLLADPSFNELIAIYRQRIEEKWNDTVDVYLDLGMSNMIRAESQIAERLDEAENEGAEPLPLAILDRISQGRADRFGYSKHSTLDVKHDFASMLDRAIARSGKQDAVKQIEATAIHQIEGLASPQLVPSEPVAPLIPRAQPAPPSLQEILKRRKVA